MTPAGLYVHLPWCARKCPYCDFNSHVMAGPLPQTEYVAAVLDDLDFETRTLGTGEFGSIFIGGGTPSLFAGDAIARLLDGIADRVQLVAGCEITLEANPGSAEAARFAAYRAAGVNRLSLGIQSFDDPGLVALGRVHDAAQARAAIEAADAAGFDNLNLDLMFGLPAAGIDGALADLDQALAVQPAHISWYQLTLEEGTAFARKPPDLPVHDDIAAVYEAGLLRLAVAGYQQYEVSAHARPGRRAWHNLNYWRYGDYLGLGAGAHGKWCQGDAVRRRARVRSPERYLRLAGSAAALAGDVYVEGSERVVEFMLNALRLKDGFAIADFERACGIGIDDPAVARPLATALERGWLEHRAGSLAPSAHGFRFLTDLQLLFVEAPAPRCEAPATTG